MSVSSVKRITQYLPDGGSSDVRDKEADTSCDHSIVSLPSPVDGYYTAVSLEDVQNPLPASERSSDYETEDSDTWSDSPINQPGLLDSKRYGYGRFGTRYRNLDSFAGVVIHDRDFSNSIEYNYVEKDYSGEGSVRDYGLSSEGHLLMQDHESVSGDVTVEQYNFLVSAFPSPFSYKNSVDTDVSIKLSNYTYPLNSGTITLELDGEEKTPLEIVPFYTGLGGFTAKWYNDQEFDYNEQVDVVWRVYDEAPSPNEVVYSYWFRTVADHIGPRISNKSPAGGSTGVAIDSCISFDLRDFETGVNISTLECYVNNVYIDSSTMIIEELSSSDGYSVYFCPPGNFLYGDNIAVSIYVEDVADEPNYLFDSYIFTTEESKAPSVVRQEPVSCIEYVSVDSDVSVFVVDGGGGVDEGTIILGVDDETVDHRNRPIIYRED